VQENADENPGRSTQFKMAIGIISDTHDNVESILRAVKIFKDKGAKAVIHCGDVVAPKTIEFFKGVKLYMAKGNCDCETDMFKKKLAEINGEYLGEAGELTLESKRFLVYHGQDEKKLDRFIKSQKYDYVLTGHTHEVRDESISGTRVLNPGAHYYGSIGTIMILDLTNGWARVFRA
jgi:putative phosphoesterase